MDFIHDILARVVLLLQGLWDTLPARLHVSSWSVAPGGWMFLTVGLAFVAILAVVCYRKTTEGLSMHSRVLLMGLRTLGMLALLIVASGLALTLDISRKQKPQVLVVVDDSPSMSLPDSGGTRFKRAQDVLGRGGLLETLNRDYDTHVVTTSGLTSSAAGQTDAMPQDLARSVVRATGSSSNLAHVLLISDGRQSGRTNLASAAQETPAPITTLAFDAANMRDVVLMNVNVPPYVYQNDRAMVSGTIRSLSFEGDAVVKLIQITSTAQKEVATTQVSLKPGTVSGTTVRVEFKSPDAGLQRYVLKVMPVEGELTDANNEIAFHLDVRPEKIKVLYIEGAPNWEYKFIKEAIEADPVCEFYGLIRQPGDEWFYQGKPTRPDGKPVIRTVKGGFPASDELNYFDVVILGDLERKLLEQAGRFEMLESFVRQRGGGLVTLGGYKVYSAGNYEGTVLADMIPIDLVKESKKQLINRFNVQITTQGLLHPTMQLEFDPVKNEEAWSKLPWVEGGNAFKAIKPGAAPLMVHPKLKTSNGPRPLAAAWQCGAGRVYSSALDGTWHWRLARKTDTDYHMRYWGQVVRWLATDPRSKTETGALVIDDPVVEVGKPVTFSVTLKDKEGNPLTDAIVDWTLEPASGSAMIGRSFSDPVLRGRYSLTYTPRGTGALAVKVAVGRGEEVINRERAYEVSPSRVELLDVEPEPKSLAALSEATGGKTALISDFQSLKLPEPEHRVKVQHMVINVWHTPGLVILLVICLCIEWLMRKRRGLA